MTGFPFGAQVQWKERSLSNLTALCTNAAPLLWGALSGGTSWCLFPHLCRKGITLPTQLCWLARRRSVQAGGNKSWAQVEVPLGGLHHTPLPATTSHLSIPRTPLAAASRFIQLAGPRKAVLELCPFCHDVTLLESHFNPFFCSFATLEGKGPDTP